MTNKKPKKSLKVFVVWCPEHGFVDREGDEVAWKYKYGVDDCIDYIHGDGQTEGCWKSRCEEKLKIRRATLKLL